MTVELTDLGQVTEQYGLSIDHQLALRAANRRLTEEFAVAFTADTIERFLAGSYDQFAANARFPNYVHILAERFARQRLIAFAQVEGHLDAGRPIVLFVCDGNDLHSHMARGLMERHAGNSVLAWSAGVAPAVNFQPGVEDTMSSMGVSLANEFPKPIAPEMLAAATTVVTFGCADRCPVVPGRTYLDVGAPGPRTGELPSVAALGEWLDSGTLRLLARL